MLKNYFLLCSNCVYLVGKLLYLREKNIFNLFVHTLTTFAKVLNDFDGLSFKTYTSENMKLFAVCRI